MFIVNKKKTPLKRLISLTETRGKIDHISNDIIDSNLRITNSFIIKLPKSPCVVQKVKIIFFRVYSR